MKDYSFENPSPRFLELSKIYRTVHETGLKGQIVAEKVFDGASLLKHIPVVAKLAKQTSAKSILDYGSGKGRLYGKSQLELPDGQVIPSVKEFWGVENVTLYDPGVEEYSHRPTGSFDGVVSTDVLEHIPEEDIGWVLRECFGLADLFLYMNIASYPARKQLPNGWNAHVTIQSPDWWRQRIEQAAQGWGGIAYAFDVAEHRSKLGGSIARRLGGSRWKVTRIESSN